MFELGRALSCADSWLGNMNLLPVVRDACLRTVELYRNWCAEARRAIFCWIWCAQQHNAAKDIRILVADLVWGERSAWSERKVKKRE